jgi:type IV pilus assembly protein PilE
MLTQRSRGFTLIEVMVTVAIIAILAGVALPSYSAYVQRSKVPPAFDALSSLATRMEQRYQDTGSYACPNPLPTPTNFTITCATTGATNQNFNATATGTGALAGYAYTINQAGARATTAHPKGTNAACWSSKGGTQCDS